MNDNNAELKSIVSQATVYINRARLTRACSTSVETGSQKLVLIDLPLMLDPDSLRVKASGTARTKILGVDIKHTFFKDVPPGKTRDLTDQIRNLEDEDRVLQDNNQSIQAQIKHVDGLSGATKTYAVGLAKGNSSPESHGAIIDFLSEKRSAAQTKLRQNEIQRRDLGKKISKLQNELKQVMNLKPKERYSAIVELDVNQAGYLDVELMYTIPGARWKPIYDIRLEDSGMEISYLGQVNQSTGEDWKNVKLVLSTVPPSSGHMKPELHPWYLNPILPRPAMKARSMMGGGAAMAAAAPPPPDAMMMTAEVEPLEDAVIEVEEADFAQADIRQSGASVTYAIGNNVDIPGDGSPHKTSIYTLNLAPNIEFVTAPKKENKAYRRIKADNQSQLMLLPGTVQIFDKEDFIGKTTLKHTAPGEQIKFYAGTDDRIRIERKLTARDTDKKMMSDKRRIRYEYEITLENHTGSEHVITVRDQIPIPRHENIKVKLENTNPKVDKQDGLNRLQWQLNLKNKDKKYITYEFTIEYPRDMNLTNLP